MADDDVLATGRSLAIKKTRTYRPDGKTHSGGVVYLWTTLADADAFRIIIAADTLISATDLDEQIKIDDEEQRKLYF
jgi:hypothetical protein